MTLPALPRMADVTLLVTAAERSMGAEEGSFYAALMEAQKTALREAVQASTFVQAVLTLMRSEAIWEGAPEDLWKEAAKYSDDLSRRRWPSNASVASKELDEHEIALNEHGITFERFRRPGGNRDRTTPASGTEDAAGRARAPRPPADAAAGGPSAARPSATPPPLSGFCTGAFFNGHHGLHRPPTPTRSSRVAARRLEG